MSSPPSAPSSPVVLQLFIVGASSNSREALENLRRICDTRLTGGYQLEVIDVLENPDAAEAANIVATPTLIRQAPLPQQRIVGNLSVTESVLRALGLGLHA